MVPMTEPEERAVRDPDADQSTSAETDELEERELTALLAGHADPETWGRTLRDSLHALDTDNARAVLAARPGAARLNAALARAAGLAPAPPARAEPLLLAPDRPARADRNARRLLADLLALRDRLEAPEPPARLSTAEDRALALTAAARLSAARDVPEWAARLAGVRARLAAAARARARLAASVARAADEELVAAAAAGLEPAGRRRALRPLSALVLWLRAEDPRTHAALLARYAAVAAPDYERRVRVHCDAVRDAKDDAGTAAALAQLVSFVESACGAEEDFCLRFFHLDADAGEPRRAGPDTRRALAALLPALEPALLALLEHVAGADGLGAMRVLAAVGARALEADGGGAQALAALAVAAKRRADRAVLARAAALEEGARRARAAPLAQPAELEEFAARATVAFAGGRRAELERWLATLAAACARGVEAADVPRVPRAALRLRGYHALHAALSSPALRSPALAEERRRARASYEAALAALVSSLAGRPLAPLAAFAGRVSAALAGGAREADVRFGAGVSRHELRAALAAVRTEELRRSLRSLWRGVRRAVPEHGLRAVVWRGVQQALAPQVSSLGARLAACYAGAALPYDADEVVRMCDEVAQDDD